MRKKTVAAFDFDGTITTIDTFPEFIRFACGNKTFYAGFILHSFMLIRMKLKLYPNWKAKQRLFSYFFKNMPLTDFDKICQDFCIKKEKYIIRPQAKSAIQEHVNQGNDVLIISASIDNWIKPFAQQLGISYVLGTQIEVNPQSYITGRFSNNNCYGSEKVRRIKEIYPDKNEYKLVAYGDSRGDKELLDYADESYYKCFK